MGHHHSQSPGPLGVSTGGSGGRRPGPRGVDRRQRARSLNATDARLLLQASLPVVLQHMSDSQVQQMQTVLDAAVVDPVVQREADDLYRRSIIQSGSLISHDPKMVRRAYRAMDGYIRVTEADKRIRLDYKALLTPEALKATTDNPDEVAYLESVRQTLAARGVWLRIGPKYVRDPGDPSRHIIDGRTFNVWLSLGPDGDAIPTESGQLTREALLGTTVLGAGYYQRVHQGKVQSALDKEIRRLQSAIESGLDQHNMLARIRADALPGVAAVSDLLGGADFPDRSIWDLPHKLVLRALGLNVGGNVVGSQAFLVVAATVTRNAARLLASYLDDSTAGVERAVKILTVVKVAAEVTFVALSVTGAVGLAGKAASVFAGETAATGAVAASEASADAAIERGIARYVARNGLNADELAEAARHVPGPPNTSGYLSRLHGR